jgi:FKBP-type peptidyl-prolyl cis-trans isomerase FkpA
MAHTIIRLLAALVVSSALSACGPKQEPAPLATPSNITELKSEDLKVGEGAEVVAGQIAVMQYTGWLYETAAKDNKGKQFDSSKNAGKPFKFRLGTGDVIKGWDKGVLGMKVGGSRRLVIPPELGYGDSGAGGVIPPGATLVFDVDLVGIEPATAN